MTTSVSLDLPSTATATPTDHVGAAPPKEPSASPAAVLAYLRAMQLTSDPQVLVQHAVDLLPVLVPGCHHASVTTSVVDGAGAGCASDATSQRADELQLELDEGPIVQAVHTGHSVVGQDLRREERWPHWCGEAVGRLHLGGVLSVPILAREQMLGTLTLYSHTPSALADVDLALLHATTLVLADALGAPQEARGRPRPAARWSLHG